MPKIKLENIMKQWGRFYAVDNLNLDIADNAFITLLGPSGCGKTTTLRMIAGLDTPTSGRITIGDQVVFDSEAGINVPANKRKVGFLFQNYALWPNMTVYENIAFGLTNIKEEMPVFNEEAKRLSDKYRVLRDGERLLKILSGKHSDEVIRNLIDTYIISQYTAKDIYDLKVEGLADGSRKADVYDKQLKDLIEELKARGETLNDKFEVCKDGQPIKIIRKLTDEEIDLSVQASARIVKVGMFMGRYPAEMSGGQQQRVAIARTLAPKPKVLFMDEPLSNLDAKLRLGMRYELQRLHVTTGATFVYVTHDQMEAMTLATKICLMNNGVLQQYDAPLDVYLKPNNLFVADFVGNPSINFIEAVGKQNKDGTINFNIFENNKIKFVSNETIDIDQWQKRRDDSAVKTADVKDKENKDEVFKPRIDKVNEVVTEDKPASAYTNEDFVLGVRPEYIKISKNGKFKAEVYGAMPTGMESTVKLRVGNFLLTSVVFGSVTFPIGEEVCFDIAGDGILLFDRKSGKLITSGEVIAQ